MNDPATGIGPFCTIVDSVSGIVVDRVSNNCNIGRVGGVDSVTGQIKLAISSNLVVRDRPPGHFVEAIKTNSGSGISNDDVVGNHTVSRTDNEDPVEFLSARSDSGFQVIGRRTNHIVIDSDVGNICSTVEVTSCDPDCCIESIVAESSEGQIADFDISNGFKGLCRNQNSMRMIKLADEFQFRSISLLESDSIGSNGSGMASANVEIIQISEFKAHAIDTRVDRSPGLTVNRRARAKDNGQRIGDVDTPPAFRSRGNSIKIG